MDRALWILLFTGVLSSAALAQQPMGEGIVKPRIANGSILRFYTGSLRDPELKQTLPPDSIQIRQGQNNFEIAYAPPWFVPEIAKLDYEILQLRATTVSKHWIEVIVNSKTNKKAWVERDSVDYYPWQDFLLSVFSIELIDPAQNPLRLKPLDNAAPVTYSKQATLLPQAISGDWMQVAALDQDADKPGAFGWIRWKKGNLFLITWSLLS